MTEAAGGTFPVRRTEPEHTQNAGNGRRLASVSGIYAFRYDRMFLYKCSPPLCATKSSAPAAKQKIFKSTIRPHWRVCKKRERQLPSVASPAFALIFLPVKKRPAYFTSVTTTALTGMLPRAISLPLASALPRMPVAMLFVLFCSAANSAS